MQLAHIEEPQLEFGYNQQLDYPRDGLFLFGPVEDGPKVETIKYGVIGTKSGLEHFKAWSSTIQGYIQPPEGLKGVAAYNTPYPGFEEAFKAKWPSQPHAEINTISKKDVLSKLSIANRHEAVKSTVDLYVDELVAEHNRTESPPDFWFVVVPEEVYRLGRPQSIVPVADRTQGSILISEKKAEELKVQAPLFQSDEEQAEIYKYSRDFRRQLKARLLQHKIVTQLVRETTLAPESFLTESGRPIRRIEDPAKVAWSLTTASYYKAGGRPWQIADVRPGVCYVGLVYKRSLDSVNPSWACCAAQMFLSNGEGVVFRGALGPWYSPNNKQFHLDKEAAKSLLNTVISEYKRLHSGSVPKELFMHAKASFWNDEWSGFEEVCPSGTRLVGVQIRKAGEVLKLFRAGKYPVIRGTALKISDSEALFWTMGYVPRLDTYLGPETPNPVSVKILRGDTELDVVLKDILGLTKINFNSCLYNESLPVTIRFADAVGDVLIAAPVEGNPVLPFKYYI